jgi:uncharacterized phage-associated protein
MDKRNQALPPKLEAVLIRLGRATPLNVTQAVKLPYLVDVVAAHALGHRITEGTHQAWGYGVVTREVWHYLDKCEASSVLHVEPVPWSEEKKVVIDSEEPAAELTPEEQRIVDFVAQKFATLGAVQLGRMTKLMNPEISSWGSNRAASVGADAYDRMDDGYQAMAEQAASLTLDDLRRDSVPVFDIEDAVA